MRQYRFAFCPFGSTGINTFLETRWNFIVYKTEWVLVEKQIYNHLPHTHRGRVEEQDHQGFINWIWDKNKIND